MYQSRRPEHCDHRSAYFTDLVSRTERGYQARCPQCGASGPVRLSPEAARRALVDLGDAARLEESEHATESREGDPETLASASMEKGQGVETPLRQEQRPWWRRWFGA